MVTSNSLTRSAWAESHPLLTEYYDTEWGMPVLDDQGVFERLSLEGFQAGLSWLTILKKRDAFREVFAGFDPVVIAEYDEADVLRLLSDKRIIRNRAKIEATISNARATLRLREQGTSLAEVVWGFMPERSPSPATDSEVPNTSSEAVALAKRLKQLGFHFVGPTTAFALMGAIGIVDVHLVTSHRRGCSELWNTDGSRRD